ncbi:MAG: hypothetical protein IJT79_09055 [Ruminococcus sp.]|nr:hypothetical protein [Ruminococcus sp.]
MKKLYKTPEIIVEELTKQDVLCASSENTPTPPTDVDNQTTSFFDSVWDALTNGF